MCFLLVVILSRRGILRCVAAAAQLISLQVPAWGALPPCCVAHLCLLPALPRCRFGWRYDASYQAVQYRFSDLDKVCHAAGCMLLQICMLLQMLSPAHRFQLELSAAFIVPTVCSQHLQHEPPLHHGVPSPKRCNVQPPLNPPGHHGQHRGGQQEAVCERRAGLGRVAVCAAPAVARQPGRCAVSGCCALVEKTGCTVVAACMQGVKENGIGTVGMHGCVIAAATGSQF